MVYYGFGDASGSGFGATIETKSGLRICQGVWGRDSNKDSSNYKELTNLVETIESEADRGTLSGAELFLFTDNSVAESCYFKGTSRSRKLFMLVLRLRKLELHYGLKLHVVHIAGTRMIAQGTDGVSRGNLLEGVLAGNDMLSFVPLHETAFDRSPSLKDWIKEWLPDLSFDFLTENDWFDKGLGISDSYRHHPNMWCPDYDDNGKIWTPAPTSAFTAMTELVRSRHMDSSRTHIFVCPRLYTHEWRKGLLKTADITFYIPAGAIPQWPESMHEPLLFGIILPFSSSPPWQLRGSAPILELERELQGLWKGKVRNKITVLRKFWKYINHTTPM